MLPRSFLLALLAAPAMAQSPSVRGQMLVANQQDASASIVDLPSGTTVTLPVGTGPHETAISADGRFGVVSIYGTQVPGNQLAVIDMRARTVLRTIDLGEYKRPHGMIALKGDPFRVVVTSEATQNIVTVDVEQGTVLAKLGTMANGSHMLAMSSDASRAFTANVGSGSISLLDRISGKLLGTVAIAPRSEGIAATPDGSEVWVGSNDLGTVTIVNAAAMKIDTVLTGFAVPYRLAISADRRVALICEAEGGRISIIDLKSRQPRAPVLVGGSPRGVTVSPDSKTAFVTLGPENAVVVVDIASGRVTGRFPVGAAPDGVSFHESK